MLSKVYTTSIFGLEGYIIAVETDISSGWSSFFMVAFPTIAVRESRERVSAAIKKQRIFFPRPADYNQFGTCRYKKKGRKAILILPIAIGILLSSSQIYPQENCRGIYFVGRTFVGWKHQRRKGRPANGAFALRGGYRKMIVPKENAVEAALVGEGEIICGGNPLRCCAAFMYGKKAGAGLCGYGRIDAANYMPRS
jgi:magnesium chelatase family protein